MFLSFIDKISSIFDRRFLIAYWLPSFVFVALLTGFIALIFGVTQSLMWWDKRSRSESLAFSAGMLFLITILALLLQPFTRPLTRLYLGYWPSLFSYFTKWGKKRERQRAPWTEFEVSDDRLLPTRLGNVLASAYEYPHRVYQIDPAIWLPRLTPLLPETFRAQMDNALTPLFCLLNLSANFSLLAFVGGFLVAWLDQGWKFFLGVWLINLSLSVVCYRATVSQASEYGTFIRVAFDLYRPELIKQMRFSLPQTPKEEFDLWGKLGMWLYFKEQIPVYPWPQVDTPELPLNYENYKAPAAGAANTMDVSVKALVKIDS